MNVAVTRTHPLRMSGIFLLLLATFGQAADPPRELQLEQALVAASGHEALTLCVELVEVYAEKDAAKADEFAQKAEALMHHARDRRLKMTLFLAWGEAHRRMGGYEQALTYLQTARKEAEAAADTHFLAKIYREHALLLRNQGQTDACLAMYEQAVAVYQHLDEPVEEAATLGAMGLASKTVGRYEEALTFFRQGLVLAEAADNLRVTAHLYSNIAIVHYLQGSFHKALENEKKTLELCRRNPECQREGNYLNNIASTYAQLGDWDTALEYLSSALETHRRNNDDAGIALALSNISQMYQHTDRNKEALQYMEEAVAIHNRTNNQGGLLLSYRHLAGIHLKLENVDQARSYLEKAVALNEIQGDQDQTIKTLGLQGRLYLQTKNYEAAMETFQTIRTLTKAANQQSSVAEACFQLARVSMKTDRIKAALTYLEEAERVAEQLESRFLISRIYLELSRCWEIEGDFKKALEYHRNYLELREEFIRDEKKVAAKRLDERIEIVRRDRELDVLKKDHQIQGLRLQEEKATSHLYATWLVVGMLIGLIAFLVYSRYVQSRLLREQERHNQVLEEKVQYRTAQLRKRMDELETFERLVRTINKEYEFEAVIEALLKQGAALLTSCRGIAFLRLQPDPLFYTEAGRQHLKPEILEETQRILTGTQTIAAGIHTVGLDADAPFLQAWNDPTPPEKFIIAEIRGEERSFGALIFGKNNQDLSDGDRERLSRFREHAILALTKAAMIRELAQAQEDFTEAAHLAGMAEVAGEVLHNLGNTLNSVRTSLHVMEGELNNRRPRALLEKIHDIFVEHRDVLEGLSHQANLDKLPGALMSISQSWNTQVENLESENRRLGDCVSKIQAVLADQSQVAQVSYEKHTDLGQLIEKLVHRDRHRAFSKPIDIRCDLAPVPPITLNRFKLNRMMSCLLENAFQAIEASETVDAGLVTIKTLTGNEGEVVIEITDNGEGFSPQEHHKLFENGYTTRPGRTGAGLHYAANALARMKGAIHILSDGPDLGARVVVRLPVNSHLAA